ncbi:hypothetical protein [Pseudomonas palmensis]|uniref:hypothetical protein n=1 Tax=Pseudomonas palmensis TaxID=2815362 RepID=UPI001AE6689B|nr:hypothetical protein [Pseudomonas palmensis]
MLREPTEVTSDDVLRWMDEHAAAQKQDGPLSELEMLRAAVKELEALRDARVDEKLAHHQGEPVSLPERACEDYPEGAGLHFGKG